MLRNIPSIPTVNSFSLSSQFPFQCPFSSTRLKNQGLLFPWLLYNPYVIAIAPVLLRYMCTLMGMVLVCLGTKRSILVPVFAYRSMDLSGGFPRIEFRVEGLG